MAARSATGTPSWLGAVNDRVGLSALLDHGPLTRNRICEIVGVSKPTASLMMTRLLKAGVIEERGTIAGSPGRNAALYAARIDRPLGVAVDLDAAELRATVVDAVGTDHPVFRFALPQDTAARDGIAELRMAIAEASAAAGTDPDAVHTVVVGTAGYVDPGESGELFTETLPGWPVEHVRATLESALDVKVFIENDVNLAAVAERLVGAGIDDDLFALIWLGNGVGASFDVAGDLHRGSFGGAGEIGFLPVSVEAHALDPDAETVQDLVGGRAVERFVRDAGIEASDHLAAFAALAEAGPELRERFVAEFGVRIAHAVLPTLATLDPRRLVLAGPMATLGGAELATTVETTIRQISRWYPTVVASEVAQDPVLQGARTYLRGKVRDELLDTVASLAVH